MANRVGFQDRAAKFVTRARCIMRFTFVLLVLQRPSKKSDPRCPSTVLKCFQRGVLASVPASISQKDQLSKVPAMVVFNLNAASPTLEWGAYDNGIDPAMVPRGSGLSLVSAGENRRFSKHPWPFSVKPQSMPSTFAKPVTLETSFVS